MHSKEPRRLELAQLPTPVVELKNLAAEMGMPRLLMKRDDLTGLETTGNKVRKLEYVVADAVARGADTLVTHGGFQSNHCRATASLAARFREGELEYGQDKQALLQFLELKLAPERERYDTWMADTYKIDRVLDSESARSR